MRTLMLIGALVFLTLNFMPAAAHAAPNTIFVVNSNNDADDGACDTNHCSLRESIHAANAHAGLDTIQFNIGNCPCTIYPQAMLPEITDPVVIDGYSENGAVLRNDQHQATIMITLRGVYVNTGFTIGLNVSGGGSTIRGLAVNGWSGAGIYLQKEGLNVIEGNFIGTFFTGVTAAPNGFGVLATAGSSHNVIGGTAFYAMNVIAGNTTAGIRLTKTLTGNADANTIAGNYIGLNKNGKPLGNGIGIQIWTQKNVIGNQTGWNRIAANTVAGIELVGPNATGNRVQFNIIGSIDQAIPGNGTFGVVLHGGASKNKIGQPGQHNYITQNTAGGIAVLDDDSQQNSLRGNYIYFNGELSVDLAGDGITTNDKKDVDSGPNQRQNAPKVNVVQFATNRIKGVLQSRPNTKYKIDFYGTTICSTAVYGNGIYFQTVTVTTNEKGKAKFNFISKADIEVGMFIAATATDPKGNTSEFSSCQAAS